MNDSHLVVDDTHEPLLRVLAQDADVCCVFPEELPVEKFVMVPLEGDQTLISFIDSHGKARRFDIPLAYAEGARFLHMSVRVSDSFAVQVDGVFTTSVEQDPREAIASGSAKAVRFAPFLLPQSPGSQSELIGRGLFFRGLHFPGTVTPTNVSALCLCDHCDKSFRLASFHSGFSQLSYFYCSKGPHTLTVDALANGPAGIDDTSLPPCPKCDGVFRYMNPLRCPHCLQPYIDFASHPQEREIERYGNYIYGDSLTSA